VTAPPGALEEYHEQERLLRTKLNREHRGATRDELEALRQLHGQALEDYDGWPGGQLGGATVWRDPPPPWDDLVTELAAVEPDSPGLPDWDEPIGPVEHSASGQQTGSYVEWDMFWEAWEMVLTGASGNEVHSKTLHNRHHVNRDKAEPIVTAVNADKEAAREALRLRKLPQGFRRTPLGVLLPPLRSK
jgi:hypothetical protein